MGFCLKTFAVYTHGIARLHAFKKAMHNAFIGSLRLLTGAEMSYKNIIYLCAVVSAVFIATPLYAQQPGIKTLFPLPTNSIFSNGTASSNVVSPSYNTTAAAISAGKAFLINKLGVQYYDSYILYSFYIRGSKTNRTYLYFSYQLPFYNGTKTKGAAPENLPLMYRLNITLALNSTHSVVNYSGPAKPYFLSVPANEAVSIADAYGVKNGTASLVLAVNASQAVNAIAGYSIVWKVLGTTVLHDQSSYLDSIYPGIYLNVQNGSVLGEYMYNPSVLIPQLSSSKPVLGVFGLFHITMPGNFSSNTTPSAAGFNSTMQQIPVYVFNIWIAVAAIILVTASGGILYRLLARAGMNK